MKPPVKFEWKGNHHGYYGIFAVAFGLFNWYMGIDNGALENLIPMWQTWVGIGALMIIDDVIEHTITGSTPLRWLFLHLYKQDE